MNDDIVIAYVVGALLIVGSLFLWRVPRDVKTGIDVTPFLAFALGVILLLGAVASDLQRHPLRPRAPRTPVGPHHP